MGTDQKIVKTLLSAYKTYAKLTPTPNIALVIDYEKGKIIDVSEILSEIVALGGNVIFAKHHTSQKGIIHPKNAETTSIHLCSLSINLPRLAFESNKDETYFRARLALLMKPTITSMALREKNISTLIKLGANPILAANTQYMQRSSVYLGINLVGLSDAVHGILGFKDDKEGKEISRKIIETAIDVASKKGKDLQANVVINMTESDDTKRFVALDGDKYGKDSILKITDNETYSQGVVLDADATKNLTLKSAEISEYNKITKILNGGLLVQLKIQKDTKATEIKKIIEKACNTINSFKPIMKVSICGNCGLKDERLIDKCPNCKSQLII